jgi:acylphosphatase
MICKKCVVSGRVQGVWYRDTTRRKAVELSVGGHALNLPDGNVEVIACGSETAVNQLAKWLWTGSPMSNVTDVQCEKIEPVTIQGFSIG